MKKIASLAAALLVLMFVSISVGVKDVRAEEMKMVGPVAKIETSADGKTVLATLKDGKTGELVVITITDDLTLDKFKEKKIVEGDEIRAKYDKQGDKNIAKIFKKTAGC